jgi:hypothetical protein
MAAWWLASCLATVACSADRSVEREATLERAIERITPERIRTHVGALAHDSMRGRDTDDVGYERARDYVAREYQRIGLQPIDGDSYLQPFDLLEVVADRGSRLTIDGEVFAFPDVIVAPDWHEERSVLSADGVYVENGLVSGATGAEAPADLEGKVVFVLAGAPEGRADEPEIAMRERAEVELAFRAGAVAVVVLDPTVSEAAWASRATPRRPVRALADGTTPSPRPTATIGPSASARLLARWSTRDVGPVTIEAHHELRRARSWNVIGRWPGASPDRAAEVIVFVAHLDHVGIGEPDEAGDSIYNGTHDNALGVAKMLAAAEALTAAHLDRGVLFLAAGAEESGLLGTWHYVNHPVVPLERTAATINHDGGLVGVRTDDVFTWGPEFSTVRQDVDWAASRTGLRHSDDKRAPFAPSAGLLYRSDHYPFLISGVPVVYMMPGFTIDGDPDAGQRVWEDYLATVHHGRADDFDPSASYASPVALTALSVRLAWRVANREAMPETHADAPVAKTRGTPSGWFFAEPLEESVRMPGA